MSAQFMHQKLPARLTKAGSGDGFDAMGKPIPTHRKEAAQDHCRAMGLVDAEDRFACIQGMSEQLARDNPHAAMEVGMRYLDLTGTYRLMAVLLTAERVNA